MGLDTETIRGLLLVVLFIAFIGVCVWAWSSKRNKVFHQASLLPLEEDDGEIPVNGVTKPSRVSDEENADGTKE